VDPRQSISRYSRRWSAPAAAHFCHSKTGNVAAFIMEPISINLGVMISGKDVIRRVRDLCRRYGTLFIANEVASGFGRTGRVFACEHFDLDPDMLCVAKAMSGGLAGWRGDRDRGGREVDGRERRDFLLDLRLAPAQRCCGDRGLARP
jgi:adenosylmethionine-8-amino-7-oxononanoate aminotransferase